MDELIAINKQILAETQRMCSLLEEQLAPIREQKRLQKEQQDRQDAARVIYVDGMIKSIELEINKLLVKIESSKLEILTQEDRDPIHNYYLRVNIDRLKTQIKDDEQKIQDLVNRLNSFTTK